MPEYLDIANWSRSDLFEFFRDYTNPYFNICAPVDVTRLVEMLHDRPNLKVSLAFHYLALRVANEIEPFRYRLEDADRVVIYELINGGTTVLLPNESFAYAYFDYHPDLEKFVTDAAVAVDKVAQSTGLEPTMREDVIYFSSLPWIAFTSFAHARKRGRGDSIPRIVFGKFTEQNGRLMLPVSVEVHHALMDGLHVGKFFNRLEELCANPERIDVRC